LVIEDGWSQVDAAAEMERSARWLRKWLRRYEESGVEGLRDLPRVPNQQPTRTDTATITKILAKRDELERDEFASIGAATIHYELWEANWEPLPSISTIERVLRRAGMVSPDRSRRRIRRGPSFPDIDTPGRYQQIDWVGPRWVADRRRFSSIHLVDVGGGAAAAAQYRTQQLVNTVEFLTGHAWPTLGIPLALSADNQFCWTTHRHHPWTLWTRACLLFGAEAIVTPPRELGWHNHIEAFNGLFQNRTLNRHRYQTLTEFTAASRRFIDYWQHQRPHPRLSVNIHGTRYPAVVLNQHRHQMRWPPDGFQLSDYRNRTGEITLPLARGRLTFLRRVQPGATIHLAGGQWPVPAYLGLEGEIVTATILTGSSRLIIRYQGDIITRHRYQIPQPVIEPYHPPHHTGLYHHRTGTMS
jgi:transposase